MTGHIYTEGVVSDKYPEEIKAQILAIPAECDKIVHHIKSPGGNVYAAWKAIPELMKIGKPVEVSVEGEASSIASWLMVTGSTSVEATDPSTFMIHEPFFPDGLDGALGVDDLGNAKTELEQIRMAMAEAYAKKSNKPVQFWLDIMAKKTRMTTKMARDYGLVDKIIQNEPRRIAAEFIEEFKHGLENEIENFMNIFRKKVVAEAPKAVDLKTKDGKTVMVQSEDGVLVGKPATVDGAPANGTYELEDGKKLVCAGGVVTEVQDAAPQETAEQKLARELANVKSQLDQLTAAKAAEEQAKVKAEEAAKAAAESERLNKELEEKTKQAAALAEEVEKLKAQTVGTTEPPDGGTSTHKKPAAMSTQKQDLGIMATRTFLADHMPWLERNYKGKHADGTDFSSYRSGGPNAVSILETNLGYTWNGVLSQEVFFKPTLSTPAIADIFTVDLGSSFQKQYHIAPNMDKVLKPYTGCGQAVTGSAYDITSKRIQLKPFQMHEGFCKDDFTNLLTGAYNQLAQDWLKTGNASYDPAGTPIDRMITDALKDALRRDVWRRISFGDTTSSDLDYNQIDGLWQSLIDQSGASNYCVFASKTNFGTGALSATAAYNELIAIFKGSSNLLKEQGIDKGKGRFLVTRSVWENLYDTYTGTGAVTELAFKNAQDGLGNLTFRGIPVIPITIWDDFLAEADNPLTATTRHLIAFTVKENHILGVENTADLDKIESWYEMKDQKRYYRANMTMGFLGAIHCDLTTISY